MKKKHEGGFTPSPMKLSPEVVAARKALREKELYKTSEERAKEIVERRAREREKMLKEAWAEKKWEIIGTYVFLIAVLVGVPLLAQLLS